MEMKYKCINQYGWIRERSRLIYQFLFGKNKDVDGPEYGDVVTVIGRDYEKGVKYFHLLEWPSSKESDGWQADCFVPYDEDHETEWAVEETTNILSKPVVVNK